MTACTNHGGKARRVVTAALVGVLSVGTVPMAALAEGVSDGISTMFADPEGAFSNAKIDGMRFTQGDNGVVGSIDSDGVYNITFDKNQPVELDAFHVSMYGTGAAGDFDVDADSPYDDFEVAYYNRGTDGKDTGDEITGDVTEVGKYVAVVTAVKGNYEGGVIYIPFNINAIQVRNVTVDGSDTVTYNAEAHTFDFKFDGQEVTEGIDYTVYYVPIGHDATEANATEVKAAGDYRAVITGIGNYQGTVVLSKQIHVKSLDLDTMITTGEVKVQGITSSSDSEPQNPYMICIDGVWYSDGDKIMDELEADINNWSAFDTWFENGTYSYTLTEKGDNPSIEGSYDFTATKVENAVSFLYDGEALPESHDVIKSDPDTMWESGKVTAFAADGTTSGTTIPSADVYEYVYDQGGNLVSDPSAPSAAWQSTVGSYTVIYTVDGSSNSYTAGGQAVVKVNVYRDAVNADASAAVLYKGKVVSSVETTYQPSYDVTSDIKVAVRASNGAPVTSGYDVKYYNADGIEVDEIVDAGTYTLKLVSSTYKLSGTTEMTITVSPLAIGTVTSDKLESTDFDVAGVGDYEYLPWREDGYAVAPSGDVAGLGLYYKDADGVTHYLVSDQLTNSVIRVVITDAAGNEVDKIVDEGVYTIHFEARNADAENNYVMPADLEVLCVKSEHARFADVKWNDYFIDSVTWVSNAEQGYMIGYDNGLFGPYDEITRADVVGTLYKMAGGDNLVVNDDLYDVLVGWKSFDDVDGTQYYGRAIAWAKSAGIVNGHDGKFRPDDTITREEFAAMLANYAKAYGVFEAADASALDSVSDGASVSDWAVESVAWAVENKVMGNAGFVAPQSEIIRADVAGMIYNFAK